MVGTGTDGDAVRNCSEGRQPPGVLGGSSRSFDRVGAEEVAEWGDKVGLTGDRDPRTAASAELRVGENRVPPEVPGEMVPVASWRAAEGLKKEGGRLQRGLLCWDVGVMPSLGW